MTEFRAHSALALDGVWAEKENQEGVVEFASIVKDWLLTYETIVRSLRLECGSFYPAESLSAV